MGGGLSQSSRYGSSPIRDVSTVEGKIAGRKIDRSFAIVAEARRIISGVTIEPHHAALREGAAAHSDGVGPADKAKLLPRGSARDSGVKAFSSFNAVSAWPQVAGGVGR